MEQKDIIDFAKSAYEAFPNDATKADLLIREFIRNGENLTKSKDTDMQITKQKWLIYTSLSFGIAIIVWGVFFR